jgi:Ca2+-binding EF-hand superfamily protein
MPGDMDIRQQMKITNFFLTITEWDRHIELTRQFLNAMESFEPYAAYLRLNNGTGEPITAENIALFLQGNGFSADTRNLKTVVRMFDSRIANSLDFEDFLKMILSRDNPDLRFNAVSNPTYEVDFGQKLSD